VAASALRRALRARLMAAAAAVLTIMSAGILATAPQASAASYATITGAGSTWAATAINTWSADVAANGLQVNYAEVGSTAGRNDFKQGLANFAASEIPYGVQDGNNFDPPPTRGYTYMPDVAGGLAFMYNLIIGGQRVTNLRLSGAVIAGIFTGQITMWNDPAIAADNPGLTLPATPVIPVVRTDGSGETWQFTQWMAATQSSSWTAYCTLVGRSPCTATSAYPVWPGDPAMIGQAGDTGVSGYVAQSQADGAIGFVAYSYALQAGFPVAKVLNAAGYYTAPTAGNVGVSLLNAQIDNNPSDPLYLTADLSQVYTDADPRTYELSYYSYLILPTDQTFSLTTNQGYSLGAFGSFALCQGQQQVDNLGYSALPINLVEDGYAQLQKIPGAQVPATTSQFIQNCNNPTFSPDGTNRLATNDPMPPACDQQGTVQCAPTAPGAVATLTTVTASPNPVVAGQAVTLTATVSPLAGTTTPAGSVQFEVGSTGIGAPVPLNSSGVASTTGTFTTAGTQVVSAVFAPADPTAFIGSAGTVSVLVTPAYRIGITVTVTNPPAGAFTFSAPTSSTITMTMNGSTATGAMNPITITDTRNTYPGWSVVGQATDFTNPTSQPAGDISDNQLGWAPTGTPLASGVVLGGTVAPVTPGLGTIAAVLAYAKAGTGFGTSTLGANLTLAIPPGTPSGAYDGVLTLTADPAGP
jgi:phosphate ABC transporter phosphate-binding protein